MSGPSTPPLQISCQGFSMRNLVQWLHELAEGKPVPPYYKNMESLARRSLLRRHAAATTCGHPVPDLDVLNAALDKLYEADEVPWPTAELAMVEAPGHPPPSALGAVDLDVLGVALEYLGANILPEELIEMWGYLREAAASGAKVPAEFKWRGSR